MWNVTDWQNVVFSDESRFVLGTDDNRVRVWRRPDSSMAGPLRRFVPCRARVGSAKTAAAIVSLCNDLELAVQDMWAHLPQDNVWRSSWPLFVPNRDPPDTPQQSSSVRSCIIIHQNEVVTNSSSIYIYTMISKTSYGSSMEHSVWPPSEIPAQTRFHHSITVSFNSVD
ncbi:hypothetical protein TNCV_4022051 [Trichonephila clavipes]|nr:hypothetical protein TNCV_4022051 [Trichonephila clavipes]